MIDDFMESWAHPIRFLGSRRRHKNTAYQIEGEINSPQHIGNRRVRRAMVAKNNLDQR